MAETSPQPPAPAAPTSQLLIAILAAVAITLAMIGGYHYLEAHLRWVNPDAPPAPKPVDPTPKPKPVFPSAGIFWSDSTHA